MSAHRAPRRFRPRLLAAAITAVIGLALVVVATVPANATSTVDRSTVLDVPAPGHSVQWTLTSLATSNPRTVVLTVPGALGAALDGANGMRFTLTTEQGKVVANGLSAEELRNTPINLGSVPAKTDLHVFAHAELPVEADNGFRTASATMVFRFSSESTLPGGLLAHTGLDVFGALALAVALIVVALVLLLWSRRRRRGTVIVPLLGAACALVLVGISATSWAIFTDRAGLDVTAQGQFGIGLRDSSNVVRQATDKTVSYTFEDAGSLVPGNTAVITLAVFNDSVAVQGRIGLRLTGAGSLAPSLRYSVAVDKSGTRSTLLGNPDSPGEGVAIPVAGQPIDLGVVDPAGVRLKDGDAWPVSADSSLRTLTVYVHLPDDAGFRASSSGSATVTLDLNGSTL